MTVTTLRQVSGSSICASTCVRVKEGTSEAGPAATTTPRPDAKPRKCDLVSLLQLFAAHTRSQRLVTKDIPPPKVTVLNAVRASQETPRSGEREQGVHETLSRSSEDAGPGAHAGRLYCGPQRATWPWVSTRSHENATKENTVQGGGKYITLF